MWVGVHVAVDHAELRKQPARQVDAKGVKERGVQRAGWGKESGWMEEKGFGGRVRVVEKHRAWSCCLSLLTWRGQAPRHGD